MEYENDSGGESCLWSGNRDFSALHVGISTWSSGKVRLLRTL